MGEQSVQPRTRRGPALAVVAAGALLVCCAVLPWAGLEARSDILGGGVASDIRGIDDAFGLYTLIAGLAALACGLAGVLTRPRLAALAAVPGGVAVVVLVLFLTQGNGLRDRISVQLGDWLSIAPVIRGGWFGAMACALAVVVLAIVALLRRA
ncbi:hypothetical protein ACFOY2_00580 [Nonomuraea purpurea]|uniref:DUF3995 domain-containing protein n=1 Tax=Nonomuraea purpurea TaxID=1849276 RepID=A0ABV8FZI8_9ACTN